MAIQFPDSPKEDDQFTASNGVIYTYENGAWNGNSASGLEDVFVNISGDSMTGNLLVGTTGSFTPSTPAISLNAADGSAEFAGGYIELAQSGRSSFKRDWGSGREATVSLACGFAKNKVGVAITDSVAHTTDQANIKLYGSGNIVAVGDIQSTSQNGGPIGGFRNQLINGDFRVWQRGTSQASITNSSVGDRNFRADRWFTRGQEVSGGTPTQGLFTDGNINKHRFVASGLTSGSYLGQRIEADNIRHLAGQTITLSFYASYTPSRVTFYHFDASDTIASTDITSIDSLGGNRYSVNFSVPSGQMASSPKNIGLQFFIQYGAAGDPLPDGNYDTWNAQIEPGPVATVFEHRPIGTELALCQRYYCTSYFRSAFNITNTSLADGADSTINIPFPVEMRATPSITGVLNAIGGSGATFKTGLISKSQADMGKTGGSPANRVTQGEYFADAEL